MGHLPWIALILAASFGTYGLVKKRLALPPAEGLQIGGHNAPPAGTRLSRMADRGRPVDLRRCLPGAHVLLLLSGIMTALPLLLFADAANRIPLTMLGILQYITPVLQLFVGLLLFHEPLPPAELVGFALVWLAIGDLHLGCVLRSRRTASRAVGERRTAGGNDARARRSARHRRTRSAVLQLDLPVRTDELHARDIAGRPARSGPESAGCHPSRPTTTRFAPVSRASGRL